MDHKKIKMLCEAAMLLALAFYAAHYYAPYETFPGNPYGYALDPVEWLWGNVQGVLGGVAFIALIVAALRGVRCGRNS